jgi:hypothetical protein
VKDERDFPIEELIESEEYVGDSVDPSCEPGEGPR